MGGQILSQRGSEGPDIKNFEKVSYRTVVSTHTENFSILAQIDSVQKSRELNRLLGGESHFKKSHIQNIGPNLGGLWRRPYGISTAGI